MSEEATLSGEKNAAVIVRYPGQRTLIGDSTIVRILKIEGSRVYLQVEANSGIKIMRPSKEEDIADKKNERT
ncbi:MAG: carbon storage regulator [Bdellovibrionales bacterium]|nr:carbon storage regulator [Bdellovibrionales bacterium]